MSITSSLNNAMSGLTAVARSASVTSSNVSNALTEGYARRELSLSSQSLGGNGAGVRIDGVGRAVNQAVLADRRLADAEVGNGSVKSGFLSRIETRIGTPDQPHSLSARVAAFESKLIEAASRPDSETRLNSVVTAAQNLTNTINTISADIQQARMDADSSIAQQVDLLNQSLIQVDELNTQILSARSSGQDATALMDQRQVLVDKISEIVPVREVARERGQIALYTTGGAILLEGTPAEIGFAGSGFISADMTQAGGSLSGLTINGMATSSGENGVLGGGQLGALFSVRDDLAVTANTQLDALARDLIARFEAPTTDPTLALGAPGLFTDNGAALNPLDEVGLSGRIEVNALVVPSQGGALWRVRDGLGAAAPGPVGNAAQLNRLTDALTASVVPASGNYIGAARSASGLAADFLSQIAGARQDTESVQAYATARQETLTTLQLADGVDTDQEMQNLLIIEQAYAANARVIRTVDELIQQIIGL